MKRLKASGERFYKEENTIYITEWEEERLWEMKLLGQHSYPASFTGHDTFLQWIVLFPA